MTDITYTILTTDPQTDITILQGATQRAFPCPVLLLLCQNIPTLHKARKSQGHTHK